MLLPRVRKSPHRVLGSRNHWKPTPTYLSMAITSLFRKVMNGRNTEKYQHLPFLMYVCSDVENTHW